MSRERQKLIPRDSKLRKVRGRNGVGELTPNQSGHKTGRKPGVPNKTTRILKEALLIAAAFVGMPKRVEIYNDDGQLVRVEWEPTGENELVGYLIWAALHEPKAFIGALRTIMPQQINVKADVEHEVRYKTVEEAVQAVRDAGLPVRRIFDIN